MENLRAATLRITRDSASVYGLLYTVRDQRGGAVHPATLSGDEQLRILLQHFGLPAEEIAAISRRVAAERSYVLDCSHLDRKTAERLLWSVSDHQVEW